MGEIKELYPDNWCWLLVPIQRGPRSSFPVFTGPLVGGGQPRMQPSFMCGAGRQCPSGDTPEREMQARGSETHRWGSTWGRPTPMEGRPLATASLSPLLLGPLQSPRGRHSFPLPASWPLSLSASSGAPKTRAALSARRPAGLQGVWCGYGASGFLGKGLPLRH